MSHPTLWERRGRPGLATLAPLATLACLACLAPSPARAQAGEGAEAAREAEMFGEPAPAPAPADPEADREAALFGAPEAPSPRPPEAPSPEAPTPQARPDFAETLQVGGRLWLRTDAFLFEDTRAADQTLQMPNLLDVYLDARPHDRVRAYARFRLTYDPTRSEAPAAIPGLAAPAERWQIDQLWLKWDLGRIAWLTVGAQPVRWGTGRLWNPTDVLNRNRLDPLTPVDFRLGVPMARIRFPIQAIGGSLELIADLAEAQRLGDPGAAARLQWVAGPSEWSLSARARRDQPLMLGLDGSAGLGPIDLYAETALTHGGHPRAWRGSYRLPDDAAIAAGPLAALAQLRLPEAVDRDADWIPQLVVGAEYPIQYSDQDSLILGAEYFYNDAGYAGSELYPWLLQTGDLQPFYLARHALAAYAVLLAPGDWDDTRFVLNALLNLSDRTGIARLNISHTLHRQLFLEPYIAVPFGPAGGEYRFAYRLSAAQARWLGDLGSPLPFEGGLNIPAPVFQAGLWLRVLL